MKKIKLDALPYLAMAVGVAGFHFAPREGPPHILADWAGLGNSCGAVSKSQVSSPRIQGRKDGSGDSMPVYFDFGDPSVPLRGQSPANPLKLVVEPRWVRGSGLMVRVEVWNLSNEDRMVMPIHHLIYDLRFRDGAGRDVVPRYPRTPVLPLPRSAAEFSRVAPGNCLSAGYLLPGFYERVSGTRGLECRGLVAIGYPVQPGGAR
jgi:hypothetical protein